MAPQEIKWNTITSSYETNSKHEKQKQKQDIAVDNKSNIVFRK